MTEIKKPKTKPSKFEKVSKGGHYIYKNGSYWFEERLCVSKFDKTFKTWEKQPEIVTSLKPENSPHPQN